MAKMNIKTDLDAIKDCSSSSTIDISVSDLILTPLTCASLINEILKCLIYQKSQIPYPYNWLKTIVTNKRMKTNSESEKKLNFTADNHFRTVSTAYDNLENIMKNIRNEFTCINNELKEIIILFGSTPFCPKEVFTIKICNLAKGHSENNHMLNSYRNQHKILREIFLSQKWIDSIDSSLTCTNTYVFLKKTVCEFREIDEETLFIPAKPPQFAARVRHVVINLNYDDKKYPCCENLEIFGDYKEETVKKKTEEINEGNTEFWCQSTVLLQGFKDRFINNVPVSELW